MIRWVKNITDDDSLDHNNTDEDNLDNNYSDNDSMIECIAFVCHISIESFYMGYSVADFCIFCSVDGERHCNLPIFDDMV